VGKNECCFQGNVVPVLERGAATLDSGEWLFTESQHHLGWKGPLQST